MEKKQILHDYICLRCGRRVVPEGAAGDDTAPILYDLSEPLGLDEDGKRDIPAYFTLSELKNLVSDPESDGSAFQKLSLGFSDLVGAVSERLSDPKIKELTPELFGAYLRSRAESGVIPDEERIEGLINRCMFASGELVGDLSSGRIDVFCAKMANLFFDENYSPKKSEFRIKVNLASLGKAGTTLGYSYKLGEGEEQFPQIPVICGEPGCYKNRRRDTGAPVPAMAWQNEHIAIGFIGAAGSGKTCLITAILSKLLETSKLVDGDKYGEVHTCLSAYESNHELPKTELEGRNSFNATVVCGDKLITLVDISGECFDLSTGKFYKNVASNHFRMIRICRCYVLCLDPKNLIYSGKGLAAQAVCDFVDYLRSGSMGYAAPVLLTMTKCDCDAPDFECYDLDSIESEDEAEARFELFLERSDKLVAKNYPSFYTNVRERAYTAAAVTSAYGCVPMPDERDMAGLTKLRETYKSLSIYLTEDGRYYVSPDEYRKDFLVPKNVAGQYYVVKKTDEGRKYIFDPGKEDAALGLRKLSDLKLIPNDPTRVNKASGRIFESEDFASVPSPRNIGVILEWLLRVCGARRILYTEFDEGSGVSRIEEYKLKAGDRFSRDDPKTSKPKLAAAASALFNNPTELDRWADEYSKNSGSRLLMGVFKKIGFEAGVDRMLGTVKRKGQS